MKKWSEEATKKYSFPLEVLEESWYDDQIIGREEQIKLLIDYIVRMFKGYDKHVIIQGNSGCGKTYSLHNILRFFDENKKSGNYDLHYFNAPRSAPQNTKSTLLSILQYNKSDDFITSINEYNREKQHVFIFDHLSDTPRLREYLEKVILPLFETHYFSMILVSRNEKTTRKIHSVIQTPIEKFVEIDFNPYSRNDLFSIAHRRIQLSRVNIERWALRLIAGKMTEMGWYDCRTLLEILRYAVDLKLAKQIPTNEIIDLCEQKLSNLSYLMKYFDFSNPHIFSLLEVMLMATEATDRSEIYNYYAIRMRDAYTKIWLHKNLHKMEKYNLIDFVDGVDRRKRKKSVILKHDPKYLRKVLEDYRKGNV